MEAPSRLAASQLLSELDQELARTQGRSVRVSRITSLGDFMGSQGQPASPYLPLSPALPTSPEDLAQSLLERLHTHKTQFQQGCDRIEARLRSLQEPSKA